MQTVLSASTELAYYGIEGKEEKRRGHSHGADSAGARELQEQREGSGRQQEGSLTRTDAHGRCGDGDLRQ